MKTTGAFATLKIIHNALLAGQIIFTAVLFYLGYNKIRFPVVTDTDKILQVVAIALAAAGFFGGAAIFKKKLIALRGDAGSSVKTKFEQYRAASIIQWAMLEMPILFCGIGFFLSGNYAFLALAAVLMFLFSMLAPNKSKIAFQLGVTIPDIDDL